MGNMQPSAWHEHVNHHNSQRLSVVIMVLVALFIPLSVYMSQQEQDVRQEAANNEGTLIVVDEVPEPKLGVIPGELVVEFKSASDTASVQSDSDIVEEVGGRVKKRFRNKSVRTIEIPKGQEEEAIEELENQATVETVEQDSYASILTIPNDPKFIHQYGFDNSGQQFPSDDQGKFTRGTKGADIDMPQAWDVTQGREDILIAVLDTGIDASHPDLQGKVVKNIKISETNSTTDRHGHGTHVAGTIAANTGNSIGVAGVCPKCKLLNIKVMGDNGQGRTSWITEGIYAAIAEGADIINISAGTNINSPSLKEAVDTAVSRGILVVAAAGNCGDASEDNENSCPMKNMPMYPAYYDNTISVSATDAKDKKPAFANSGPTVDVAAPGALIVSTWRAEGTKTYAVMSGTSMATPMVSGLAGLLFASPYGTSAQNVRNRIEQTADKIEGTGTLWQYGRINAAKALAQGGNQQVPTPTPTIKQGTTPVPTSTTTPASNPLAANLSVTVLVNGVGSSLPGGNANPVRTNRQFTVELTGVDSTITSAKGVLTYNPSFGAYIGVIPVQNIQSGDYAVSIYSAGTLKKRIPGAFTITQTKSVTLPRTTLSTGDINTDNKVDIRDFNILAGCYSDREPAKSCTSETLREAADLNDDGQVNQIDYNLFIRNLTQRLGE